MQPLRLHFIEISTQKGQGLCLAAARLHGALHLSLAFAVFDGVALVVLGLAFGQRDFAFDLAVFPVQVDGYEGVALLFDLANETLDFVFLHQQLFGAHFVGGNVARCGVEWVDLAADQIQLAIANDHIAVGELHLALAGGFDLPAFQHHACLELFFEEVVVRRFFVVSDARLNCRFFGSHLGDVGTVELLTMWTIL
jgi:hypothetical protein